jgi:AraC-like DNA-binding protein
MQTSMAIVTDVRFAPHAQLERHTHARTIFGVMLEGSFQSVIQRRTLDCRKDSVWTEPRGEPHANFVGADGAHVLAIQPDPDRPELFDGIKPLLDDVRLMHYAGVRSDAARISRELQSPDGLTPLAVDALVLQMLVTSSRLEFERKHHGSAPRWLLLARDMLRAAFAAPPSLDVVAMHVGVSTSHLAHAFKRFFRTTPGQYLRQARAEWAREEVVSTSRSMAEIAHAAGYSDQAHFTREIRRVYGVTPGVLRVRGIGSS